MRTAVQARHRSTRSEQADVGWIRRYILDVLKRDLDRLRDPVRSSQSAVH